MSGLSPGLANSVPSLFASFIGTIEAHKAMLVFKHKGCDFKGYTVLLLIQQILLPIPFVAQLYIQV